MKLQVNDAIYTPLKSDKPIHVHQGGTSSGKTYGILQHLFEEGAKNNNEVITVAAEDVPSLKSGAYRDAKEILNDYPILREWYPKRWENKTDRTFQCHSGTIIEFKSFQDSYDARSGKRDRLFINEANAVGYEIFEQLNMRTTKQTIIDFNPSARFWAHENLYEQDDVEWTVTTFRDNAFLDDRVRQKILSYEPTPENIARGTANEYKWKVYGLGEVGRLEGLVFPNFEVTRDWPIDWKWRIFGLDFGFCVDEETEALTDSGWKDVEQLEEGDKLLTLNPDTGKSEWHEAERINIFYGDHDVIEVEGQSHSSVSTRHHKWMIEGRGKKGRFFRETQNIAASDKILCSAECDNLPKHKEYSDSFVELVAWFYTEGQIDSGGISIWQDEGEHAERIRNALRGVFGCELENTRNGGNRAMSGWVERPKRRGNSCHFAINLNGAERFKEVAPNKVVSNEFITSLTADQLELFIDVSIMADGSTTNGGTRVIGQKRKSYLDPLQMACSLLGYRTTLKRNEKNYSYKQGTYVEWVLSIFKNKSKLYIGELFHRRKSIKESKRNKVWCPTVKHSTWLARRNGNVYFTGNTNDPTALVEIRYAHGNLYWKQHIYDTGLTNPEIATQIQELGFDEYKIVADSAEPKSIEEIRRQGCHVVGAEKGKDSVNQGIDAIKRYPLYITADSDNLIEEFSSYIWKEDKDGNPTNKPIDDFNHGIDAGRYALSNKLLRSKQLRVSMA